MMHKAWCSTEEVPYNFFSSSIKFQGHIPVSLFALFSLLKYKKDIFPMYPFSIDAAFTFPIHIPHID